MSSPYLPPKENSWRALFHELFMRLTYDVWRRNVHKYICNNDGIYKYIVECGCGPGYLLQFLKQWYPKYNIIGLDLDMGLLSSIRRRIQHRCLVKSSAEVLPIISHSIDLLIALHMIEHLSNPEYFLSEAYRVLRPGAYMIVATPNPKGIGARIRGLRWTGWREDHLSLFPPEIWRDFIQKNGFRIVKDGTTGLSGIPLMRMFPISLLNWIPLFLFGFFPWVHGEAYICIAQSINIDSKRTS